MQLSGLNRKQGTKLSLDTLVASKYKLANVCIRELDIIVMEVQRTDTSQVLHFKTKFTELINYKTFIC